MDAFDRHEVDPSVQLENAFDGPDAELVDLYDVDGEEDVPPLISVITIPELSLGEEKLDLAVDECDAEHRLDYLEIRGRPGLSPLARAGIAGGSLSLQPHLTSKNFPGKSGTRGHSLEHSTWRIGEVLSQADIYLLVGPDPNEDPGQRARDATRGPSRTKGKLKTSVTTAHGEILSKWVAKLIGDDGYVQARSLSVGQDADLRAVDRADSVFTDLGLHRPPPGQDWDLCALAQGPTKSRLLNNRQTEVLFDKILEGWAGFAARQGAWFRNTTIQIVGTRHGQNLTVPTDLGDGPETLEENWSWINPGTLESVEFAIATDISLDGADGALPYVLIPDLASVREDFTLPRVDLQCFALGYTKDLGNAQSKGGPNWLTQRVEDVNQDLNNAYNAGSPDRKIYLELVSFQVYQGIKQSIRNNPKDLQYQRGVYTAGLSTLVTASSPAKFKTIREEAKSDQPRNVVVRQVESAESKGLRHVRIEPVYRIRVSELPEDVQTLEFLSKVFFDLCIDMEDRHCQHWEPWLRKVSPEIFPRALLDVTEPFAQVMRRLADSVSSLGGHLTAEQAEIMSQLERLCNIGLTGSPNPMTALLRDIGAAGNMRIHGLPLLLPEHIDLVELTISKAIWPRDTVTGGYKLSFTSAIEYNFDLTTSLRMALFAQLDLQTGRGRLEGQRAMGKKVVEAHLKMCATAVFDDLHRATYNYFYGRYKTVAMRRRGGTGKAQDAALARDMEDGLDEWRGLVDEEKMSFHELHRCFDNAPEVVLKEAEHLSFHRLGELLVFIGSNQPLPPGNGRFRLQVPDESLVGDLSVTWGLPEHSLAIMILRGLGSLPSHLRLVPQSDYAMLLRPMLHAAGVRAIPALSYRGGKPSWDFTRWVTVDNAHDIPLKTAAVRIANAADRMEVDAELPPPEGTVLSIQFTLPFEGRRLPRRFLDARDAIEGDSGYFSEEERQGIRRIIDRFDVQRPEHALLLAYGLMLQAREVASTNSNRQILHVELGEPNKWSTKPLSKRQSPDVWLGMWLVMGMVLADDTIVPDLGSTPFLEWVRKRAMTRIRALTFAKVGLGKVSLKAKKTVRFDLRPGMWIQTSSTELQLRWRSLQALWKAKKFENAFAMVYDDPVDVEYLSRICKQSHS